MSKRLASAVVALAIGAASLPGRAYVVPVFDAAAVLNLIQQVLYWEQQIEGMSAQLNQLRQTYASMNGVRGMQSLLPTSFQQRNYLPPNYNELMNAVNNQSPGYAGLAAQIQAAIAANAVLSNGQLADLSPEARAVVESGRRSAALATSVSQVAYANTSQRFAALQQLITAIGSAGDLKAVEDLQARTNAEQAMLANEQAKLQVLAQVVQADRWAHEQRVREQATADVGSVNQLPAVPY